MINIDDKIHLPDEYATTKNTLEVTLTHSGANFSWFSVKN